MTVVIGTWGVPLVISLFTLVWGWRALDRDPFGGIFVLMFAIIISLVSWLVWALVAT